MLGSRIVFIPAGMITPQQIIRDYALVGGGTGILWGTIYLALGDIPRHFHIWSHFALFGTAMIVAGVHWSEDKATQCRAWKQAIKSYWIALAATVAVGHVALKLL